MYTLLLGYEVQGTTGDTVTDMNWSSSVVLPGGTINLIYLIHYLIVCLLLLLSGDVELNPGPITGKHTLNTTLINSYMINTAGNPKDILRTHSHKLTDAISTNLYRVTDAMYAKGLIPLDTKRDMYSGENESKKTGKLVIVLQTQLEASVTPDQYLIDICHVLINQQHQTLTDIATNILHQLGE